MDFTQSQFAGFFDAATWSRGVAYARAGSILAASFDETKQLAVGSVRGSGRNVYRQTIRFVIKRQGAIPPAPPPRTADCRAGRRREE